MTDHLSDYTDDERSLFEALPRTSDVDPRVEESIVRDLRHEGLLGQRKRSFSGMYAALAAALVLAAWLGGVRYGARKAQASSIEGQLSRGDLSANARVLLLQRAGSAYVTAANAYAANVKETDAAAAEVSSQVLLGAAQAVARTKLDGAFAQRIATMVRDSSRSGAKIQPVIWY